MTKRVVWTCILGHECACAHALGAVDQFCINSRRKEIKEDDNEEAYEEKAPFLSLV
jgi:hypothetical protein